MRTILLVLLILATVAACSAPLPTVTSLRTILLVLLILATVAACTAPRPTETSTPVPAAPTTDVDATVQAAIEATLTAQPTEESPKPEPTDTPVPTPTVVPTGATPVPPTDTPAPVTPTLLQPEERYDVVLTSVGTQKIQVIRVVRELTGLGLREAKDLVEQAPSAVLQGVSEEVAGDAKSKLEAAGAAVGIHTPGYLPPEVEPEDHYDVVLTSVGAHQASVIRVVQGVTHLCQQDCEKLVEEVPSTVLRAVCGAGAENAQAKLEAVGATVELRTASVEETRYDVGVAGLGPKPDDVLHIIAELNSWELRYTVTGIGWGLYDAPPVVLHYVAREEAENTKARLETAGATALLELAQCPPPEPQPPIDLPFLMPIEDVFTIKGRGTVVTGRVSRGSLKPMTPVEIVGLSDDPIKTVVTDVEMFHKKLESVTAGDNAGLLLRGVDRDEVQRGQVVALPDTIDAHRSFVSVVYVLRRDEGGRHRPFFTGYRPQFYTRSMDVTGEITLPEGVEMVMPGDLVSMTVTLAQPVALEEWQAFAIREGGLTVGAGWVTQILE